MRTHRIGFVTLSAWLLVVAAPIAAAGAQTPPAPDQSQAAPQPSQGPLVL